jgi:dihydroorotase
MSRLSIQRPDDWHVHLRDGAALKAVVGFTAQRFGRAIVMPNLKPAITTTELARAYRQRILAALPAGSRFEPLLTLYLTDTTSADEIDRAHAAGFIHGVKLYPAGATTHSAAGVTDIKRVYGALAHMEKIGM